MAIVNLSAILEYINDLFAIDSSSDVMVLTSNEGSTSIDVPDGTYTGAQLATALQTAMNADDTLTGDEITFSVTYTASTAKFTIDAGEDHTIALTYSTSDAADTFGFTKDHAAAQTITSDFAVPGAPESEIVSSIQATLEGWIKAETGHDWEDTDYVEFVNGTGTTKISLDHYPVDAITEIAPITSGIKIKNTSTDSRNAYVSIDSDSLDLAVIGGENAMTATLAFADYATLTLLIAQINDEGKGWDAVIYDTDYGDYPSACLREIKNFFCGASRGTAPTYSYLKILDTPYSDFVCDEEIGEVYRSAGWNWGYRNIVAKYSAYGTIPDEITGAVLDGVKFLVTRHQQDTEGLKTFRLADLGGTFEDILPGHVLQAVRLHSKVI